MLLEPLFWHHQQKDRRKKKPRCPGGLEVFILQCTSFPPLEAAQDVKIESQCSTEKTMLFLTCLSFYYFLLNVFLAEFKTSVLLASQNEKNEPRYTLTVSLNDSMSVCWGFMFVSVDSWRARTSLSQLSKHNAWQPLCQWMSCKRPCSRKENVPSHQYVSENSPLNGSSTAVHDCEEADIWVISGAKIGFHRLYSWGFQGGAPDYFKLGTESLHFTRDCVYS